MSELVLRNRQRVRRVNLSRLRRLVRSLLDDLIEVERYELCVQLVTSPEITRLNETFLRHAGPTDVITFDHGAGPVSSLSRSAGFQPAAKQTGRMPVLPDRLEAGSGLHGEIFVCVEEAVAQARRYRTSWQSELARYVVHGVLHLCGYDDRRPAARRRMKRAEDGLLRQLAARFPLNRLARKSTLRA